MKTPTAISLVVRAWNEADMLQRLLDAVAVQDYPGKVELVVVDNGSTDPSAQVAKKAGAKVIYLSQSGFSYPKSLNLGINATSNEIVVEVVAHALPVDNHWLSSGLQHFTDPSVAGVYAPPIAFSDASLGEWILYGTKAQNQRRKARTVTHSGMGVFGSTNIILRRSIWEEHPFDENFAGGGEDEAWARWALSKGHKIICEPGFAVYHSHGLKTIDVAKQWLYWRSLKKPRTFDQAVLRKFRPDIRRRQEASK